MEKDNYIGRLLDGRYEILEVIGTGGMAVVYKAKCHRLNRMVAVKILKDEFSKDEEFRRRFHGESQAVAMLSHPNIVSIYDVSSYAAADYIVMELIDGITLKQYMEKKGILSWKETMHFAIQIAKALEHAHSKGIVHRDIKPHNVMVLKTGAIKVMDFGIAQTMAGNGTVTKEALGSVHYISPEQAKGGRVDNRSDIYSLGIVMYEMISGRVPYDGDSPVNIALQHLNGGAEKPSAFNPNTPHGLEQIIVKAMALKPQDRYATATAMLYDMDEIRKNPEKSFVYITVDGGTRQVPGDQIAQAEHDAQTARSEQDGHAVTSKTSRLAKPIEQEEEEQPRTSKATIVAVVSCITVGIVALALFVILLFQSGVFAQVDRVKVPNMVGKTLSALQNYTSLTVVVQEEVYNAKYPSGQVISQYPLAGDSVPKGTKVFVKVSRGEKPPVRTMGDLVGKSEEEAKQYIRDLELSITTLRREEYSEIHAAGKVTRTEPAKNQTLTKGQEVTLWISVGAEVIEQYLPNVVGQTVTDALQTLKNAGFVNVEQRPVPSTERKGKVLAQTGDMLVKIDVTTLITLDVSTGEAPSVPPTTLPTVTPTTAPSVQPSKPVTTKPTQKPGNTVEHEFSLPVRQESFQLGIKCADSWVLENMTVEPGATSVLIPLEGTGTQTYLLYIDGKYYTSETVDFGTHE